MRQVDVQPVGKVGRWGLEDDLGVGPFPQLFDDVS